MESSLTVSGFEVIPVTSLRQAREACEAAGLDAISAVISDYRLPDGTGIELLNWIRIGDETLASVIITGQGEKSIVQQSIAAGAFDYLEKPVTHQFLRDLLWRAVEQTRRQRQSAADRKGLEDLERLDQSLSVKIPPGLAGRMRVFYRPLHEVGGDFFITHERSGDRWLLLMGDISGHDIRSGFVSTYFQGMFRGCMGSGAGLEMALQLFNRSLRGNGPVDTRTPDRISLSLLALDVDPLRAGINYWNYGLTPCFVAGSDGFIRQGRFGRFPLGWMEEVDTEPDPIPRQGNAFIYLFTDGLLEYASQLELNAFSLLYRFMHATIDIRDLPQGPTDDIVAICFHLTPEIPLTSSFEPILSEHYAGTEVDHIDHLQANWRRSLAFTLGDRLGDRIYELLICIREGMLNALIHGCERADDKFAHLQISLNADKSLLRVVIDDPGRGHSFDLKRRLTQLGEKTGKNLGLGIIQHLSDDFHIENKGTSLVFDFEISAVHV